MPIQRFPIDVSTIPSYMNDHKNWLNVDWSKCGTSTTKDNQGTEHTVKYYNGKDHKGNPFTIKFMTPTYITRAEAGRFANKPQIAYTYSSGDLGVALKCIVDRYEELINNALNSGDLKINKKKAKIYLPVYNETSEGEELENPLVFVNIGVRGPSHRRQLSCTIGECVDIDGQIRFKRFKNLDLSNLYEHIRPRMLSTGVIYCDTISVSKFNISLKFTLKQLVVKEEEEELPEFEDLMSPESLQAMAVTKTNESDNEHTTDEKNNDEEYEIPVEDRMNDALNNLDVSQSS